MMGERLYTASPNACPIFEIFDGGLGVGFGFGVGGTAIYRPRLFSSCFLR